MKKFINVHVLLSDTEEVIDQFDTYGYKLVSHAFYPPASFYSMIFERTVPKYGGLSVWYRPRNDELCWNVERCAGWALSYENGYVLVHSYADNKHIQINLSDVYMDRENPIPLNVTVIQRLLPRRYEQS